MTNQRLTGLALLFAATAARATSVGVDVNQADADLCVFINSTMSVTKESPVAVDTVNGKSALAFRMCEQDMAAWPQGPNAISFQSKRSSDGAVSVAVAGVVTPPVSAPVPAPPASSPVPAPPASAPVPQPPASQPPAPPPTPTTWTQIGVEGQTIKLSAPATVRYGIDTRWAAAKNFLASVACTNATFGDPAKGTRKVCQSLDAVAAPAPVPPPAPAPTPTSVGIWSTETPASVTDGGIDTPVTIGTRFTSTAAGLIAGMRFYKYAGNTGAHVGNLWSAAGTKLATATFSGETASGWQSATFAPPVAIAGGAAYVISYQSLVGHYAFSANYFGASFSNPPLSASAGLYKYGASPAFPNLTFQAGNYWVDVIFKAN